MEDRPLKYRRKINFITEKVEGLVQLSSGIPLDAILYRLQTSIEAVMDIAAMLVKDLGENVSDDYHNLDTLVKKKVLLNVLAKRLKSYNGLRNAIVHKYNAFEEKEALHSLPAVKSDVYHFLESVEHALKKIFPRN